MGWLRFVALVMLTLWIGGLAALGAIAAPQIFEVLQTHDPVAGRELAGTVFAAAFRRFQSLAWVCGGFLLVGLGIRAALGPRPPRLGLRVWTVVMMLFMSVATTVLVMPRIERLRREAGGAIASLQSTDARKVAFNRLHGLANGLMLVTMVAGLGLLWFESRDPH